MIEISQLQLNHQVLILVDETIQTGITQVQFKIILDRVSFRLNFLKTFRKVRAELILGQPSK